MNGEWVVEKSQIVAHVSKFFAELFHEPVLKRPWLKALHSSPFLRI